MSDFRNNHYVPQAYQSGFISPGAKQQKFFYLDMRPEKRTSPGGRTYTRADVMRWGPPRCFSQRDLYTTTIGRLFSTAIERRFMGGADTRGPSAVRFFDDYKRLSVNNTLLQTFVRYMSLQKLRTPKGLMQLSELTGAKDKNHALAVMTQYHNLFGAIWQEGVWCLLDASASPTKFILSDHPVTIYNKGCFPGSQYCRGHRDPDVRFNGSHTLIPLSLNRLLVITNQSWLRNPYGNPLKLRPNPEFLRETFFNYTTIQTGRALSESEVCEVNHVIKQRAFRYVAAAEREWLYPERWIPTQSWDKLGKGYLFMPDPRSHTMGGDVLMKFSDGRTAAYDSYGRRPGQLGYRGSAEENEIEWVAHLAFQGEFARVFGPKRRGVTYDYGKVDADADTPDFHQYHLGLEARHKDLLRKMGGRK